MDDSRKPLALQMGRYIRKFTSVGSIGPSEERGFGIWVGYDIEGVDDDLSQHGLIRVDDWSDERLAAHGVSSFAPVGPDDDRTYETLGIRRS